jgi:carboxyl-terminal processing protease
MGWKRRPGADWDYWIDHDRRIGYVRIIRFGRETAKNLEQSLKDLLPGGMRGLILDLRGNPGGLLNSAVDISELFVGAKSIVTFRRGKGRPTGLEGRAERALPDFPLACLIDAETASAAEIVAACLQDHRRALLVGRQSQGKGSVQNIQPMDDRELKFTTAVFYRPSSKKLDRIRIPGRPADEWGVTPDPGLNCKLTPQEAADLKAHLERAEIVVGDPVIWDEIRGGFRDRQRDMALLLLRGLVKG